MRIDSPVMTNAQVTGSFSGSFTGVGNFVGLTADSVEYANVLNKPTLISSSAQITITESQISDLSHYTDADVKSKLNSDAVVSGSATNVRSFLNVEDGADVTDTANVTAAGALMDSELTDLAGIKALTVSSKQDVLSEGAFVDGDKTKLDGIEANADVTDTANVTAAGAVMDSEVDADIKTLSLPANTTISSFAKTFLDDADAAAVRATIGAEASGADNSTDVTLDTSSHDYLSISGQAITLGQIDISDDTNFGISDTTGQTGINLTLTGDTLSGVVSGLDTTSNVQFNNLTVSGDLTVSGTTTSINSTDLNVTDKLISINRGGSTAASADGGGIFISGANESITWDNGNSRFNFSDDVHAAGNITLTGTVDGRDVASDGGKLDGIESGATADQSDAEIETAYNNQVAQVSSAERTAGTATAIKRFAPADIKSMIDTHQSDTVYTHPTHPGDDISIDTGALTGATVISDLDFNVTTDTLGHVTDANATVATRTLTAGNLGLGSSDNVTFNEITGSNMILDNNSYNTSLRVEDYNIVGTYTGYMEIKGSSINAKDTNGGGDWMYFNTGTGAVTVLGGSNGTRHQRIEIRDHGTNGDDMQGIIDDLGSSLNGIRIAGGSSSQMSADDNGIFIEHKTVTVKDTLRATGDVVAYYSSDERLKDNVVEIDGALEKIEALRGVSFDWNDKQDVYEGHDVGVIAQEVEAVLPELVQTRDNGYKAVKYEKLTAVLIQAVKELSAKVKELENK